ncbi:MAG: hypothetical protein AB1393_01920 [Candidatus Edwardsbacteria bacterium]
MKTRRLDFKKLKTISIQQRISKISLKDFAFPSEAENSLATFFENLPKILAGKSFLEIARAIVLSHQKKKPVLLMMGAHPIKCGLSPIIIDLVQKRIISGIALNGAGAIHDFEIAMWGKTSENVEEEITKGRFGMTKETAILMNKAIKRGAQSRFGLGEVLGKFLVNKKAPFANFSLLCCAWQNKVPISIHVAIGTDVIHCHPSVDAKALGQVTFRDFQLFCKEITDLEEGVVLNVGSAVILPEVFIKALSVARNLGYQVRNFTAANFDMIQHYRPNINVVQRPTAQGGSGYSITGHHELMIPLLAAAIKWQWSLKQCR